MRKFFLALFVALVLLPVGYIEITTGAKANLSDLPALQSGDLIFETTLTNQTAAIMLATGSIYTHVGVVHKQSQGYSVIHAMRYVGESPLTEFVHSGWGERFTILRYPGLNDRQREAIVKAAESYIGRGYNFVFYMQSKDIYCSELPYFSFRDANLPLGTLQKIGDLYMNNPAVHKLFEARWKMHPACAKPGMDYESCWKTVMDEPIITPVSLAHDPRLERIYSNYLF
jgi:hypothetical protein